MRITCSADTDMGLRRSNNEDAYLVSPDLGFFAVADGVGGSAAGEIASSIFMETVSDVFKRKSGNSGMAIAALVQEAFMQGNERILAHAAKYPECRGMGCTAELIVFSDDCYTIGHVGDSRTYLHRGGQLRQITRDHSLVQNQLEQGLITSEAARRHHLRNIVLRVVGVQPSIELDVIRGTCLPGDIFLLCSDGLTDMVEDNAIREILSTSIEPEGKVELLIESAKSAGGNDNITVILCQVPHPL